MNRVRVEGKTVEEAVNTALQELKVSREEVQVEVVVEPSKGFLGIGAKDAVVEVTVHDNDDSVLSTEGDRAALETDSGQTADQQYTASVWPLSEQNEEAVRKAKLFVLDVLSKMGLEAYIDIAEDGDRVKMDISGDQMGLVIGRRGQTLDALQYLTNVYVNKFTDQRLRVVLDTENYRERRKQTLESLADRLAKKVIRTRQKVVLEPMSPAERKIIHTHLQQYAGVVTKSEGKEPYRRVAVYPE